MATIDVMVTEIVQRRYVLEVDEHEVVDTLARLRGGDTGPLTGYQHVSDSDAHIDSVDDVTLLDTP